MSTQALPKITRSWKRRQPSRFGWLPGKWQTVEFMAEQFQEPGMGELALARFTLKLNGTQVATGEFDYPMPIGNEWLPLQIYLWSSQPNSELAQWQGLMAEFCTHVGGSTPPAQTYWG